MAGRSHLALRGGTLIEVLVSLLIVTLVLLTVVEVSVHRRQASSAALRSNKAMTLAMAWQSARLAGQDWTKGYEGGFPDGDGPRWILEPAPQGLATGPGMEQDDQWREIRIISNPDDVPGSAFLLRFDTPPAPKSGGSQ